MNWLNFDVSRAGGQFVCAVCAVSGIVLGISGFVNAILMVRRRKPGVPLVRPWHSAYDIVFRPTDLTTPGLHARRRLIVGLVGWLVCAAIFAAVGIATGVLN